MNNPPPEDTDDRYRRIVEVVGGGYLRNTIRERGVTCMVCTAPVEPQYTHCRRCYQDMLTARDRKQDLARLVLPLVYGVKGSQSGYLMYQYKGTRATLQQRSRLTLLLALALTGHRRCIETQVGYGISAWTTIPSTQGRPGDHPIRDIARQAQPAGIEVALAHRCPPIIDRSYQPERWQVPSSEVVAGRHVLVIDGHVDHRRTRAERRKRASDCWRRGSEHHRAGTLAGAVLWQHGELHLYSPWL